jgi:hypothetical protein
MTTYPFKSDDQASQRLLQRRSFTQHIVKIQQSGELWRPNLISEQAQSTYAEAFDLAAIDLFQCLSELPSQGEITWFNDHLKLYWEQITQAKDQDSGVTNLGTEVLEILILKGV